MTVEEEVRDALKELVTEINATSARIIGDEDNSRSGVPARTLALGGGEYLRVELPTHVERTNGREHDIEAAFERVIRQLRTIRRRYEVARLPEITVAPGAQPAAGKVLERIEAYMQGLASIDRASNAFVTLGGKLVASARTPDELEGTRWPFLARRVLAAHAPGSSHGEVVDPDAYAMSFWYDAALIIVLADPYAVDFVRHRARQVARELCNLLPLLEPDPDAPAAIGPNPGGGGGSAAT
ncbi:MAG TPA: hypothetical protein VLT45_15325 [Kofleriaceae bacterium]|nr:hypothetical protein [Kofleriaceae bacterium]